VSPDHPNYENALKWARNYDSALGIAGLPGSFTANWLLEKEVEKTGAKVGAKAPPNQRQPE